MHLAGIVLDLKSRIWHFSGEPKRGFRLHLEHTSQVQRSICSADFLKKDEGVMLNEVDRVKLAELLKANDDIFRQGERSLPMPNTELTPVTTLLLLCLHTALLRQRKEY